MKQEDKLGDLEQAKNKIYKYLNEDVCSENGYDETFSPEIKKSRFYYWLRARGNRKKKGIQDFWSVDTGCLTKMGELLLQ